MSEDVPGQRNRVRRPGSTREQCEQAKQLSRRHLLGGSAGLALTLAGCSGRGNQQRRTPAQPQVSYQAPPPRQRSFTRAGYTYVVQRGDTLSSIGRRAAPAVPVGQIISANGLKSNMIKPGDRLFLPGVVRMGDDPYADRLARRERLADLDPKVDAPYTLVPRSKWTRKGVKKNHKKMNGIRRITIHHTGEHAGMRGLSDVEIVKRIERYHREGRKWSAIGYHYLVGKDGRVYEGRPAHIQGAHVSRANSNNLGISCIGDFHRKMPSKAQLGALRRFLEDQRRLYGVAKSKVYGHRDLGSSICPGDKLYAWVRAYKRG